jgi:hypothetical protein
MRRIAIFMFKFEFKKCNDVVDAGFTKLNVS